MRYSGTVNSFSVILTAIISISIGVAQDRLFAAPCPCDIYAAGGTPCVAAHSTVRALDSSYNGPLYQVRRASDNTTKNIGVLSPGGFVDAATQDSFCSGTTCVITVVYDQTGKGNDMWYQGSTQVSGSTVSIPATATKEKLTISGHEAYSLYIDPDVCYWHNGSTSGMPTGAQPEGMYMVTSGTHYNSGCCFDYGNSETDRNADGGGTMDAINFSSITSWGTGAGAGPWVMADLEYGVFAQNNTSKNSSDPTQTSKYVTAILKNNGTTLFALRGANAQSGSLSTYYSGALPSGYNPMKKQGAITLGCGGDCCKPGGGANQSDGTLYEGAIVAGYPADSTENKVQANIVAAGYGKATAVMPAISEASPASPFKVRYNSSSANVVVSYVLQDSRRVSMNIFDQRGRQIAAIVNGVIPAGLHEAVWDARRSPAGVYLCRAAMDGKEEWTGKVVIEK